MATHQSLQKQQEALQELKNFLEAFKEELTARMEGYKRRVEKLHDTGLSNEVYNHYSNDNYVNDKTFINNLIRHIDDTDIPYINRNLGATEDSKETARGRFKSMKFD